MRGQSGSASACRFAPGNHLVDRDTFVMANQAGPCRFVSWIAPRSLRAIDRSQCGGCEPYPGPSMNASDGPSTTACGGTRFIGQAYHRRPTCIAIVLTGSHCTYPGSGVSAANSAAPAQPTDRRVPQRDIQPYAITVAKAHHISSAEDQHRRPSTSASGISRSQASPGVAPAAPGKAYAVHTLARGCELTRREGG